MRTMRTKIASGLLLLILGLSGIILCLPHGSYAEQDRDAILVQSSALHWTGTDQLGRDRTVRVAAAVVLGLGGAAAASAVTTALAAIVGIVAAFSSRSIAALLMLVCDLFLTLPWLFLLMMVRSFLPLTSSPMQSAAITFVLLAALGWPACAHAVYRGASGLRGSEGMIQGRAGGLRRSQLIRLHILPHLRTLLLPQFLVCIPAFIVAEANLGTLGLGVAEPLPSWGGMLLELGNSALLASSGWVYLPIAALVTVLLLLEVLTVEV